MSHYPNNQDLCCLESGFTGYTEYNLKNNTGPDYLDNETFFTIFGLFFSTVTGILAGINMSGDLHDPFTNFSPGTLVFSTNKTCHQDLTEILLKVALNTINQPTIKI
jgi:hypothetical protein